MDSCSAVGGVVGFCVFVWVVNVLLVACIWGACLCVCLLHLWLLWGFSWYVGGFLVGLALKELLVKGCWLRVVWQRFGSLSQVWGRPLPVLVMSFAVLFFDSVAVGYGEEV